MSHVAEGQHVNSNKQIPFSTTILAESLILYILLGK